MPIQLNHSQPTCDNVEHPKSLQDIHIKMLVDGMAKELLSSYYLIFSFDFMPGVLKSSIPLHIPLSEAEKRKSLLPASVAAHMTEREVSFLCSSYLDYNLLSALREGNEFNIQVELSDHNGYKLSHPGLSVELRFI